jgi:hypothetical protein
MITLLSLFLIVNLIGVCIVMKIFNKLVIFGVTSLLSMPVLATGVGSAKYTLAVTSNRLDTVAQTPVASGGFTEPGRVPGVTSHTLSNSYNRSPSCIPNSSAAPVFTNHGNGTVTDNRTCLIWLQNANCAGVKRNWATAVTDVTQLNTDGTMNSNNCGDISNRSSHQTDWRLPTIQELQSLVHYGYFSPAMSNAAGTEKWKTGTANDDAFTGVQTRYYWSSTSFAYGNSRAWYVYLSSGYTGRNGKASTYYVWPVRGQ